MRAWPVSVWSFPKQTLLKGTIFPSSNRVAGQGPRKGGQLIYRGVIGGYLTLRMAR
ncbi:hypothetical protein ABIE78_003825 [Sinorhizobium fredii]